MKRNTGLLILIALILVPILWVVLWKKSEFGFEKLPIYTHEVFGDTVPFEIDTFTLFDQSGQPFTRDSIGDRIYVANFFFTSCPDVCPQMNANVRILVDKFKNNPGVIFLSHTVDPETDSVATLAQYANEIGVDTKKWHFLTGKKRTLYDLAAKSYRLVTVQQSEENFIHSEKLVLVDKNFHIRGFYEGREFKDIQKLMDDIPFLLKLHKDEQAGK